MGRLFCCVSSSAEAGTPKALELKPRGPKSLLLAPCTHNPALVTASCVLLCTVLTAHRGAGRGCIQTSSCHGL